MDKTEPGKELNEDLTREQLIAISYRVPDTDQNTDQTAEISPKNINGETVVEPLVSDGEDHYRSELISISYLSPDAVDAVVLPPSPGQING